MQAVTLNVNGTDREVYIEPGWTLLYVLREKLGLFGAKFGCGTGDCGACKVLVDGEAVNSCTLLARKMEGRRIVTVEGLAKAGKLSPVQQAFIDAGAIQCGFCTPGMVISATALLQHNPRPTQKEICQALDNNLCRCTGYLSIIKAVELAARYLEEQQ